MRVKFKTIPDIYSMKRSLPSAILLVILCLLASCGVHQKFRQAEFSRDVESAIDSVCQHYMDKGHFPGMAVAVVTQDRKLWSKGYGYSDIDSKRPIDPKRDRFRIGSISKSVTASALARLVEDNKIDLDAPIRRYYRDCPADKADLTLRQLGGHLACIRHYNGFEFFSNIAYDNVIDPLQVFIHDTLICVPGEEFRYSTYSYSLVSALMEMATGTPFPEILQQEVFRPLDLKHSHPEIKQNASSEWVTFYRYENGRHIPGPVVDNSNKWAGGGILSTAEDIARYGYAHTRPGYLKAETLESFTRSQQTADGEETRYGIGFGLGTDDQGRRWFGHSGGSVGGTSMLLIFPEESLVVVTLINLTNARMDDLAWKIADVVRSKS
jgi:serine beta-lactamase-like protein LACTB